MVSAGDFKNGLTFEMDGNVMQIIEFQHVKPGKGSAFVRAKIKNIITGTVLEKTFNPNEKFQLAYIERKIMQYSYSEGNLKYFMDSETYDMIPIDESKLGDNFKFVKLIGENVKFLKEDMEVKVLSYKEKIFGVELPNFVELKVSQTDVGVKGNTVTNATKTAILETGAEIRVPLFIETGEVIKIDTRTGEYIERA